MPLTLEEFERDSLPALLAYAEIEAISPNYDPQWETTGELARAARLLAEWVRTRDLPGATVELREVPGRTPLLLVTVPATAPVSGTVLLYGHCDKQPPLGEWSEGLHPFRPVRRGDRVFARGVADDGYAIFAAALALEELARAKVPHARCVILIEASEESGSPDLEAHLAEIAGELGDVELLICLDSGALTYDRLWVTTSLRGNLIARVRVDVLERGLHSGVASGVVPSSARLLRQLLDRIEDSATGEIRLPELRAEIPDAHRRAAAELTAEFGDVAAAEARPVGRLALMGADATERVLNRTWAPTLSITGVGGIPDVDAAGNVLRPYTELVLSLRLPPSVSGAVAERAVVRALTEDPPSGATVTVSTEPADGWLSPPLQPWLATALDHASQTAFGRPAAFCGEGGTIPFLAVLGARYPKVQFVATGVLGPGSNAHGIDEMVDLPTVVAVTNAVAAIVEAHASAGSTPDAD